MEFSAQQIADILNGEIIGDPSSKVSGLSKIEDGKSGTLSFLANPKYVDFLYSTEASIVIVNADFEPEKNIPSGCTLIKVAEAYSAFSKLLEMYDQSISKKAMIEELSFISSSATIGENVYIGAFAYIGDNVTIKDNVHIYPNSYIGDNSTIKENSLNM